MDVIEDYEILLGTYEAFVLGYKVANLKEDGSDGQPMKELRTSFANHAHSSGVKALAAGDKYLISAGGDENVKIFNLRNRTEHGVLTHPDGALNAMTFYGRKHLLTAGEDHNICIVKATSGWSVEKTLTKHQSGVIGFAIHPSGKLLLSIGKDNKLITWNLIKGRSAYVTNIKERADFVRWSPSGSHYIVGFYKHVDVYAAANASIQFTVELNGRPNDLAFLDDTTFALSGEMPHVEIHSLVSSKLLTKFEAHDVRVRCLAVVPSNPRRWGLVTASNDGLVKVWSVSRAQSDDGSFRIKQDGAVDTKCRITCMVVHKVPEIKPQSRRQNEQDGPAVKTKRKIRMQEPDKPTNSPKRTKAKLVMEDEQSTGCASRQKKRKYVSMTSGN